MKQRKTTKRMNAAAVMVGVVVSMFGMTSPASADPDWHAPQLVSIVPENTFIPPGFDDNDNAQIVVAGDLINTCWKIASGGARVDRKNYRIYLTQQAYVYGSCWCLQMLVPYVEKIDLGVLHSGTYQVFAVDNRGVSRSVGTMPIAVARTPNPDDYTYALVQEVFLEPASGGNPPTLVVRGNFNSDCLNLQEVKVLYRTPQVIEVLPISDVLKEGTSCNPVSKPFEARVTLQSPWSGKTLIHVRSLNGHSVNQVYTL